jgi:hypothetical protein
MTQPRSSCDLAVTLALGGDCLADIALLRGEPGLYGCVACDATVSRTIAAPAGDAPAVWASIDTARAWVGRGRGSWPGHAPRTTCQHAGASLAQCAPLVWVKF